jgi:hypothetical protein
VGIGVEVGLADLEVDDLASLRLEGTRTRQDDVRPFRTEMRDAFCKVHVDLLLVKASSSLPSRGKVSRGPDVG